MKRLTLIALLLLSPVVYGNPIPPPKDVKRSELHGRVIVTWGGTVYHGAFWKDGTYFLHRPNEQYPPHWSGRWELKGDDLLIHERFTNEQGDVSHEFTSSWRMHKRKWESADGGRLTLAVRFVRD